MRSDQWQFELHAFYGVRTAVSSAITKPDANQTFTGTGVGPKLDLDC